MVGLELFRDSDEARPYPAGQVICREGDRGDFMYVVVEGTVDISAGGVKLESLGPGGVFGEIALIDDAPRIASATAASACRLVQIDPHRFQFLVRETPFFALQIMRIMADRLRRMKERVVAA